MSECAVVWLSFFFFKQKTAYEMRISDWSSDVCSSDLVLGPDAHVVAVCQPCVQALAAVAVMAESGDKAQPRSMTLMAGPIDCRINPTGVNDLAVGHSMQWFEAQMIDTVPPGFAGMGRKVYPGFVQLSAFMSMNLDRQIGRAHV